MKLEMVGGEYGTLQMELSSPKATPMIEHSGCKIRPLFMLQALVTAHMKRTRLGADFPKVVTSVVAYCYVPLLPAWLCGMDV